MTGAVSTSRLTQKSFLSDRTVGALLIYIWIAMVLIVWAFAFFPSETSPEWILQAQAACFGTLSNGLPSPHGWLLLILSPLATLLALWFSHSYELSEGVKCIKSSRFAQSLLLIFVLVMMGEAHVVGKKLAYARRVAALGLPSTLVEPLPLNYPRQNKRVPSFSLINQHGQSVNENVFKEKVTILTFAFAHCATVCPILIRDSVVAKKKLNSEHVQVVVVSVDPWRDTPRSLPSLAKSWSIPWGSHILSGNPEVVTATLDDFELRSARDTKTGDINHAGQIMVVDKQGRIAYNFLNPPVEWLITSAKRLLRE